MTALFFAEGGRGAGLGHLRRCAALADGMRSSGWDCRFLARNAAARDWLKDHGQPVDPPHPPRAGRLPASDYSCDAFIVDSYEVTNGEIVSRARGRAGLIAAFDDHMDRHPSADVILNTGVLAPRQRWPGRVRRLLGPAYHPLPQDFLPLPKSREIRPSVRRVMITLGGSGGAPLFKRIAAVVRREMPRAAIDCVLGPFSGEAPTFAPSSGVNLIRGPRSMKSLMTRCDLAVAASGQTLFELAATGTPAVAVALAENQVANLRGMQRAGTALSAGPCSSAGFERSLARCLSRAARPETRARLSESGRALVDGAGAKRVAAALRAQVEQRRSSR